MPEDMLIEKKIELLIDIHTKPFLREIADLKRIIVTLNNDILNIRQQMRNGAFAAPLPQAHEEARPVAAAESPKPEEKHHRTGSFKPGDIDIQKVFYCGGR